MSRFELARAAVTALRTHVEQPEDSKREYNIRTDLVVRESTGFPRGTMTNQRKTSSKTSIKKIAKTR
jgi:hypothetical protein